MFEKNQPVNNVENIQARYFISVFGRMNRRTDKLKKHVV